MSTENHVYGPIFYFIIIKWTVISRDSGKQNEFSLIAVYIKSTGNYIHINNRSI